MATNAAVTWANAQGDANSPTPPAFPDLSVTGDASSYVNVPGCAPNWASSSDGHGTLSNTLQVTGGTGSVSVNMSANIAGILQLYTDSCGVSAYSEVIFTMEVFGLPDTANGPQNPVVLFYDQPFTIGPNSQIIYPFEQTLTGSATLNFDTPYGFLIEVDSESMGVVPEPHARPPARWRGVSAQTPTPPIGRGGLGTLVS